MVLGLLLHQDLIQLAHLPSQDQVDQHSVHLQLVHLVVQDLLPIQGSTLSKGQYSQALKDLWAQDLEWDLIL